MSTCLVPMDYTAYRTRLTLFSMLGPVRFYKYAYVATFEVCLISI